MKAIECRSDDQLVEAGDGGGNVNKTLLLMSLLLVTACAGQPSMTTSERLELYRADAGEPVSSFQFTGSLWGWRSLGDSALAVWPRRNQATLSSSPDAARTWRSRFRSGSPVASGASPPDSTA